MENCNACVDVLFILQEIRWMGDSFWLYAIILLLVVTAVILIAAGLRSRRENDGETSCEDEETDNSVRTVNDSNSGERNVSDRGVNDRSVGGRNANETGVLAVIIDALGGMDNIYNLACSDTRLRVTVNDGTLVNRMRLKSSGALGVLAKGRQVQVFYENQVERICRELKRYIENHRYVESEQEDIDYERVLKKVYVPVEGDVVRVSDIHCLQDVGDGGIGVCAIRATRGEIRAPFDCKAGYSKARAGQIECVSKEGFVIGIYLMADGQRDWKNVRQPVNIRLMYGEGERVRKGKLLAEYPYETFAGMGDKVYVVLEAYVSESGTSEVGTSEAVAAGEGRTDEDMDRRYHLVINTGERVNYEHVACEIVE